jgi:hypothetical protein
LEVSISRGLVDTAAHNYMFNKQLIRTGVTSGSIVQITSKESYMSDYIASVVVHIDESLSDDQIHAMEKDISYAGGVYSACVHERTPHLMVVDYDPMETQSIALLHNFQNHGLHAELIGF